MSQHFPKSEHLKHKRHFKTLFSSGKRVLKYPVMAIWAETTLTENVPIQAGFSASKKHFKTAVQRNQLKRWMREAYRTQQGSLSRYLKMEQKQVAILFVTVKTNNTSFDVLQPSILLLLQEIEGQLRNAQ